MSEEAARFRTALELFELGEAMMRQRLQRENPMITPAQIDTRIAEWLTRPINLNPAEPLRIRSPRQT